MCVGCRKEGEYICLNCSKKLVVPAPICPMCCRDSIDGWVHTRCRTRYGMDRLIVGLPYRGLVQECLKKVKYKSSWEIVKFLYSKSRYEEIKDSVVTGVPMWREKERARGYNQAEIIARLVAENYKVPYLVILERARETKPQYGLNKEQRISNMEGAFKITNQQTNKLTGRRVILVDDVWTTGATMRECATVLKHAGTKEIWGITLAR